MKWKKCFEFHTICPWNYANPFGSFSLYFHCEYTHIFLWTLWLDDIADHRTKKNLHRLFYSAMSTNVHTYWIVAKCARRQNTTTYASNRAINFIGKRGEKNSHQSSIFSSFPIYSFQFEIVWMNEWMKKQQIELM